MVSVLGIGRTCWKKQHHLDEKREFKLIVHLLTFCQCFHLFRAGLHYSWMQNTAESKEKSQIEGRLQPQAVLSSREERARICSADILKEERGFYCAENRSFLRWRPGSCLTLCQLLTIGSPPPCSATGCKFRSRNYSKVAESSGKWRHPNITSLYPIMTPFWSPHPCFHLGTIHLTNQKFDFSGWADRGGNNTCWIFWGYVKCFLVGVSLYLVGASFGSWGWAGQMGGCNLWKLSLLPQLFNQQLISTWLAVVNENNTPVAHKKTLTFQNLHQSPMSESQIAPLANFPVTLRVTITFEWQRFNLPATLKNRACQIKLIAVNWTFLLPKDSLGNSDAFRLFSAIANAIFCIHAGMYNSQLIQILILLPLHSDFFCL